MLENIIEIDQSLFYFVNVAMANSVTDFVMPIVTDIKFWIPFFAIFVIYQLRSPGQLAVWIRNWRFDSNGDAATTKVTLTAWQHKVSDELNNCRPLKVIICVVAICVGVLVCDQINSSLIKELVGRPRPCHILMDINLLVGCGSGKSFPSSHAANSMMAVTIISAFYRRHRYWLPLLSVIIGISRVFVGVHFPFDIVVGWLLGAVIGVGTYKMVMIVISLWYRHGRQ